MLKQSLSQKQQQKMSPLQIQFMKLLQLNTADFIERVEQELLDNPAIEKKSDGDDEYDNSLDKDNSTEDNWESDMSEYLNDDNDYSSFKMSDDYTDEDRKEIPIPTHQSFYEYLSEQARNNIYDERHLELAMHLIGSLEDDGYLRRDLKAIVNDLAFTENVSTTVEELESILKEIQEFDPAGLGARDLKECLIIQLKRKIRKDQETDSTELAIKILEEQFEAFTKKHYNKITKALKIKDEELKHAINEITRLNPKPGQVSSSNNFKEQYVVPDFTIKNVDDDELIVSLNSKNAPELHISKAYKNTLRQYEANKESKSLQATAQYVKQKIDGAKWFIDSIRQRQNTLLTTMRAIVEEQKEFFLEGDEKLLKPMVMKDIAEKIQMDISTVSRVANSKYVETSFGIYSLKFFFSEGLKNKDGEDVSNREIKVILKDTIDAEDKSQPYTDEELMKILKQKGYEIARRTIAKYREQLNIPVSRMRKQL